MDYFSLEDKVAIVTGACGLLGTKHCEALAAAGATVVAADLDEKVAGVVAARLGERHMGIGVDVTSVTSLQSVRDRVVKAYGHIDVLVNNAAINDMFENPLLAGQQSMFENYPLEMWDRSWKVNVSGVFLCSGPGRRDGRAGGGEHYQYRLDVWGGCTGSGDLPECGGGADLLQVTGLSRDQVGGDRLYEIPGCVLGEQGGAGEYAFAGRSREWAG